VNVYGKSVQVDEREYEVGTGHFEAIKFADSITNSHREKGLLGEEGEGAGIHKTWRNEAHWSPPRAGTVNES